MPLTWLRSSAHGVPKDMVQYGQGSSGSTVRSAKEELEEILGKGLVRTLYQGIYSMKNAHFLGYEALSRGPSGNRLEQPHDLFACAKENYLLFNLERLCRRRAIESIRGLLAGGRLFINVDPHVMNDPDFRGGFTRSLLSEYGLTEEDVVIELTERSAITDYDECRTVLSHYREQGYTIAIDDAGSGYSSLQAIAELQPTYVKIDQSLICGIHKSIAKQAMVRALVQLGSDLHYYTIAEGVESFDDLDFLVRAEVDYGQGYLLGKPSSPPQVLRETVRNRILQARKPEILPSARATISNLMLPAILEPPDSPIEHIAGVFAKDHHLSSIVLAEGRTRESLCGIITRKSLNMALASQYGYALWSRKPASEIMERHVLAVTADTPVEKVAGSVALRPEQPVDDDVLVYDNDFLVGLVPVRSIIDHLAKTQMEQALNANPLTGLPGNLAVDRTLAARCLDSQPVSLLYIDIDDFKSFNDRYGFERGDQILLYISSVLTRSVEEARDPNAFAGHIGGDDFVVITSPGAAEKIAQSIITEFDRGVPAFYDLDDALASFIIAKDRSGQVTKHGLVTVSVAVVTKMEGSMSHIRLAEAAAEAKISLKQTRGSVYSVTEVSTGAAGQEHTRET